MAIDPTYIYKLVSSSSHIPLDISDLPLRLPVSSFDEESGFIHLSTSVQVLNTLKWFFDEQKTVYVLRLPYEKLTEDRAIRWEDPKGEVCGPRGGEGMFPHLYNGLKLGRDEIDSIRLLERAEDGWDKPIEDAIKDGWMVY